MEEANEFFQIIVARGHDTTSFAEWEGGKDISCFFSGSGSLADSIQCRAIPKVDYMK